MELKKENCILDERSGISINIIVREEDMDGKKVVVVNNEELGVADFGDNLDEAINNFKKSTRMYLDTYPEKKKLLEDNAPLLVSRIFL